MLQSIMKPQRIEISYKTIVFTVLFLASLFLFWQIRSLLLLIFFCFIFMEAINPTINRFEQFHIPRPLAILIIYLIILGFLSFTIAGIVPIFVEQTTALVRSLPTALGNFDVLGMSAIDISSQLKIVESLPQNVAKTILSLFSNVFTAFVIFVITFYLLMERPNITNYSFQLFGPLGKRRTIQILERLELRLGSWVNAQLFLMIIIGLLSYLGYLLLGLPYALPLALLAGVLEIVPNIGPTVATAVAALVGLMISPLTALLAVIWGITVQQLENNVIVPKVMSSAIGLNPLITILLLATGAKLGGVVGAVLAIPVYLTIETIIKVLYHPPATGKK